MKRCAGFSLVEVLLAILILGVALAGLTHGITTALSSNKESEWQTTAALIAAGQIELLRAEGYLIAGVTEGDGGPVLPLYRWKQSVAATDVEGLYDVEVVVEHTGAGQVLYTLHSRLFDPPLTSSWEESDDDGDSPPSTRREQERRNR